ncbi:uncharacterized protein L3040_002329 [Drepanopeziza brunnea f. sp. 'multigermtubi']|uniref:Uncharacterized protein n=1 Tax=Marssonina brunnea f. sp. multigermtubi (strain MB_m1) TaxID=1072389 RepID=K1XGS6_MARBU|nr:uncharacterized protein MBM_01945 [Drepanopeziza brunnea f. sp. 'multigermtubi' MB_m1]EKD19993.1 hypothetical protein MBM_01945 [Drepanopeziza brunnea f. sp. 'multigermtubi' MB_m1]KAJ5050446.1 hypothetical protein L3040_002329 [Drepanopeziza brunnea f. sp. 'multigermtubi']
MTPLELAASGAAIYPLHMRRATVSSSVRSTTGGDGAGIYHLHHKNGGNGSCTHLTCTRIFTQEFRCAVCVRRGSLGWIYRCTQDRELLLERDIEAGVEDKLDELCDLFKGMAHNPRSRSAAARMRPSSVLTEISEKELKGYTGEQLHKILRQRTHLLDVLTHANYADPKFFPDLQDGVEQPDMKPWLPLRDGECQFKVCHTCRPNFQERSFLSLNGIARNDIPPTAITGFGFHLRKARPVSLVKHHPARQGQKTPPRTLPPRPRTSPNSKPRGIVKRRPGSIGLGIFATEKQHESAARPPTPKAVSSQQGLMLPPASTTPLRRAAASARPFAVKVNAPVNIRQPSAARLSWLNANRRHSLATTTATVASPTPMELDMNTTPAALNPMELDMDTTPAPLTPMELSEQFGDFGSEPLDVMEGVAVTEEGVEMHVADVIMQH